MVLPLILIVAPSAKTNEAVEFLTPSSSSQGSIVTGSVTIDDATNNDAGGNDEVIGLLLISFY